MSDPTQYTDDFRREVVRRADSGAISVNQLADELGLSTSTIYRWRRQVAAEPLQADAAPPAAVEAEQPPKGKPGKKGKMSKKDSKDDKPKKDKDKKKDGKKKDGKKKDGKKKKSKKDGDGKKGKKDKKKK
jgi:transposase-like protein